MDELVKALRCKTNDINDCTMCAYHNACYGGTLELIAADAIEQLISRVPKWISVKDRLPNEHGGYLVYLHEPLKMQKTDWEKQYDFSYVMEMWFDKGKMLWSDGREDAYNAVLSVVDTDNEFHVTHWMELPKPPVDKENTDE